MTGRQRLTNILNRQPIDRLAWTTLVDDRTRSGMPAAVRALSPQNFYRHIGCDIVQFGNYGLGMEPVPSPARLDTPEVRDRQEAEPDGGVAHIRSTPWGDLISRHRGGHPIEYPVKTLEDIRVLRQVWESTECIEDPAMEARFADVEACIGDDGLYVPTTAPSPVQHLLEYEMGVVNFYLLFADYPAEMEELLAAMHRVRLREYTVVARRTPAMAVIAVENTSSTLISPEYYRRYSVPQLREYTDVLHQHGKKMVLHMCGHLKALLPSIRDVQADAFNAITPPPVGTTLFEDVLDVCGEDFPLFGGLFQPTVLHRAGVTARELHDTLDRLYTPRIRRANLVLWLAVDGLPTPLERFLAVRDWMDKRGR